MASQEPFMFGKPAWFVPKKSGWGLTPVTWQGWVYTAAWLGAITLPFSSLMLLQRFPEALIWLIASLGLLLWDVRAVLREMRWTDPNVVVIDDHDGNVQTENYELRVDRR